MSTATHSLLGAYMSSGRRLVCRYSACALEHVPAGDDGNANVASRDRIKSYVPAI